MLPAVSQVTSVGRLKTPLRAGGVASRCSPSSANFSSQSRGSSLRPSTIATVPLGRYFTTMFEPSSTIQTFCSLSTRTVCAKPAA